MRKSVLITIIMSLLLVTSCATSNHIESLDATEKPAIVPYYLPKDAVYTEELSEWKVGSFIDEYGVETGDSYIFTSSKNSYFSNTATFKSDCSASLNFSGSNYLGICIWEYGTNPVTTYRDEIYTFNAAIVSAEEKHVITKGMALFHEDTFYILQDEAIQILDCLSRGLNVCITLNSTEYPISKYVLNFSAEGFSTCCRDILGLTTYVAPPEPEFVGTVQMSFNIAHWFFTGNTEDIVKQSILKEAITKYGNDVTVENITYFGNWNILSLLMYFDMFGWVETIEVTADVYRYY